jgi:flagellar motility protein MotE (MotC chaperone)
MTSVALLSRHLLIAGCIALSGGAARAQSDQKPSKPMNLGEFAKQAQPAAPRPAAKPEPAPAQPRPERLATATAAKAAAPGAAEKTVASAQPESDVARFCSNVSDAALDARVAWQQKELEATEGKLRQRIAELEIKRAEYEQWLKLREDFLKNAEDSVVEIYSRMNPEAAAQQIASMADDTAAAVLAKLKVRNASAILNEMEPARGAHLADTLAGMRRADDGKTKK